MKTLLRPFLVLMAVSGLSGTHALAQPQQHDGQQQAQKSVPQETAPVTRSVTGPAGRDIRIGVFASLRSDCTSGSLPTIRLSEEPKHGKVTVKEGKIRTTNLQKCLASEVPAFIAIYRSSADFEGNDDVTLEVISAEKRTIQRITITVTSAKSMQRI